MKEKSLVFVRALIFVLAGLCAVLFALSIKNSEVDSSAVSWADFYQVVALVGGIAGLIISTSWGGVKSLLGRSVFVISLGLFFQNIGQTIFSVHAIYQPDVDFYPSLADIGFFGSVLLYIYGAYLLCKVCGIHLSTKTVTNKFVVFVVPLVILGLTYLLFLRDYSIDWTNPIKVMLDFGYPLGQALYISLALLAFVISKNTLGGVMRGAILTLFFALLLQYLADFNFLYQSLQESWALAGSYGDFLYLVAYTCMAYALIKFGFTSLPLEESKA